MKFQNKLPTARLSRQARAECLEEFNGNNSLLSAQQSFVLLLLLLLLYVNIIIITINDLVRHVSTCIGHLQVMVNSLMQCMW